MATAKPSGMKFSVGILTVSDRCSMGVNIDKSGEAIEAEIHSGGLGNCTVTMKLCVPDEKNTIASVLTEWSQKKIDLIITTGGTGFAPRDVTPEATRSVIEKEATGMSLALLNGSLQITPFAMLSRLVCGIKDRTLIINFPGSPKACVECMNIVKPVIAHAISLLKNDKQADQLHKEMIQSTGNVCQSKVNTDLVAARKRISPYPMISVQQAQDIILHWIGYQPKTFIDINNALGYVLYEDIRAKEPHPPFPASVKDGYAVIAADGAGLRKVVSATAAGDSSEKTIKSGECVRITTGAPIPLGADAVVQVEDTVLFTATDDNKNEIDIKVLVAPRIGLDIRSVGSDIQKDTLVLTAGTVLSSVELGILATLGICTIPVVKRPKIGILSTGNEIQSPNEQIQFGKIRDSNKITLLSLLKENGFESVDCGIVIDEPNALLKRLNHVLPNLDVLITSGGVSMGEHDLLADVLLTDLHADLHFGRINMKPGKPTKFFTTRLENQLKYIFALPGNPVSATVTCHLFVLPGLKAMSGVTNPLPTTIKAKISQNINLDERFEYARATLKWKEDDPVPWASLTGNQMSCRMLSMVSANCLLHLPAATESRKCLSSGEIVAAQIIVRL